MHLMVMVAPCGEGKDPTKVVEEIIEDIIHCIIHKREPLHPHHPFETVMNITEPSPEHHQTGR